MYQIAHLVNIWAVMDEQNAVLLAKLYSTLEEIVVRCCGCRVVRVVEQQRLAPGDRTQVDMMRVHLQASPHQADALQSISAAAGRPACSTSLRRLQ